MKHIERTPISRIRRMAVYENTRKLPLSQVVAEEQPSIALTGTFYSSRTWKPVCPVKADGKVLFSEPDCTYVAFAWDDGPDVGTAHVPPGGAYPKRSYIANGLAVYQGTIYPLTKHDDTGGRRGRVACGITKDGEWLSYGCADGKDSITEENLQAELVALGCETAIIMDGGGKSNLYVKSAGVMMQGRDPSQNLILIWLDEEGEDDMSDKKKVCLDAGHDDKDLGNCSPDKTYYEHEFALDMAGRIKAVLEAAGVEVTETRTDGNEVSLEKRCRIANEAGVDLFVSLHSNAAAGTGWSSARGWKVLIYGLNGARYAAAKAVLARVEGVAPAMRSPAIAAGPGYAVLRDTKAPALLIEHGFHTNQEDVALLKDPVYRQKLAYAEAAGILDWLGVPVPEFIPEKTEAERAVEWITGQGIMLGNTSGDLMLEQPLTRKQFAVMLYRYEQQRK